GIADSTGSPILTGHVVTRRKRFAVWLRAGQYVVHIGRVAAAVDQRALLSQSGVFRKHVNAVQFVEVARDQRRFGIVPRPAADAVASIHGLGGSLSAQIGVPRARACPNTGGERLAVGVGTSESA